MIIYCKENQKGVINFSLGVNKGKYQIKPESSPVTIENNFYPLNGTENHSIEGYGVKFYSPNNFRELEYIVNDYFIYYPYSTDLAVMQYWIDQGYPDIANISLWTCGSTTYEPYSPIHSVGISPTTLVIQPEKKCINKLQQRCHIRIKDKRGNIIFQDQGDCPTRFDVVCGDCPEGYKKCSRFKFPGYCCCKCKKS